jgi:O-antigen ligase
VRWYGDWDGPNVFGILFVLAIAFSVEYVLGPHGVLARISHIFLSAAYFAGLYFTNSRGAILGVGCAVLFYFFKMKKNFLAFVLAVAFVAAFFVFSPSRMGEMNSSESSAHERTWLWEQGLTLLAQHPAFGVGRGQFAKSVDLSLIAHNNYVQNFSELGLIGFFLFIAILWVSWRMAYAVGYGSNERESKISCLGRSVCCALVGYCVCTFFVVMELELHWWLLGLAVATYLAGKSKGDLKEIRFDLKCIAMIFALMMGIIGFVWLAAVKQIL